MNRVNLIGRITRDLEKRKAGDGVVVSFTIAVNKTKEEADFINCVAWNKTCDLICNNFSKGKLIGIDGKIQSRSYEDKDGRKVYIQEVLVNSIDFLEPKATTQVEAKNTFAPQNDGVNKTAYGKDYDNYQVRNEGFEPDSNINLVGSDLPF